VDDEVGVFEERRIGFRGEDVGAFPGYFVCPGGGAGRRCNRGPGWFTGTTILYSDQYIFSNAKERGMMLEGYK